MLVGLHARSIQDEKAARARQTLGTPLEAVYRTPTAKFCRWEQPAGAGITKDGKPVRVSPAGRPIFEVVGR